MIQFKTFIPVSLSFRFKVHNTFQALPRQDPDPLLVSFPLFRAALNFVNCHQAAQVTQGSEWLLEPCKTYRVFQVEIIDRIRLDELPGKGPFAALAWPDKRNDPAPVVSRVR